MSLSVADRLGPYEILGPLGAGGMGEVYRATDTRLHRDVAVKVSAERFTERFEREARVIASLNHPHICQIYDVGPNYLVMEYIEGTPLKGPLPLDRTLKYASQICDALDAAHKRNITHRDLKPANVLITKAGVKLLDFGLAKIGSAVKADEATTTMSLTGKGEIVGTLLYMSPEQINGQDAGPQSDIFSFGLVLYEMLTGKRAFEGATPASVMGAILERPAPSVADIAPAALDRVLKQCLEKDPDNRWQSARDLAQELNWIANASPDAPFAATALGGGRAHLLPWTVAGVAIVGLAAVSAVHFREQRSETQILRTTILPPEKADFDFVANRGPAAVSPDGRRLAFTASTNGKSQLWIRPLDALTAQPLAGTDGASFPFWSPDSRFVGFFADGKLKKIDTTGGPSVTLADAPQGRGGSWSKQGVIVFAPNDGTPLLRVSESGSASTSVTKLAQESSHRFPWFLPDGRHFLYQTAFAIGASDFSIQVASLDSQSSKILVPAADSNAIYSVARLLFLRGATLMAQPFDVDRLATTGEAVPVAEQIGTVISNGLFSASSEGTLAYQRTEGADTQKLTWFDRNGKPAGSLDQVHNFRWATFSPDRRHLAATIRSSGIAGSDDIWVYDVARGLPTRFTFDPAIDRTPVWSPDERTIIFASNRKGPFNLYRKPTDGSANEELLYQDERDKDPSSWSPDGRFLLYESISRRGSSSWDVWVLPLTGDRKPFPFLQTAFNERRPQFSPDGRWVAYTSNESGRFEIYVTAFPGPGGKQQISTGGGYDVRWRRDGKEIFYVGPDRRLTAAEVNVNGNALEAGRVVPLLVGPIDLGKGTLYDVAADGQRFLVAASEQSASPPLTLVQNWAEGLKR